MLTDPAQRSARLDEALIIALLLGVLPYLVLRGLVTPIARRRLGRTSAGRAR